MKKYFEFQDSKSYKFWQIEVIESDCITRYGKIGTQGQVKTKSLESADKALREAEKMIKSKTKKGYEEKTQKSEKQISKRFSVGYEEAEEGKTLLEKVEKFIQSNDTATVSRIVFGEWEEAFEESCQSSLDLLIEHKEKLGNLTELFIGDMDGESCEISWINQADFSQLWQAFPNLKKLHIKGAEGLVLGKVEHKNLTSLIIESGGLGADILASIANSNLPQLEHLQLYLGVEDYGFDGSITDVTPLMQQTTFPNVKYLGLMNSAIQDEIAQAIVGSSILAQLDTLDMSLGCMSDAGGKMLMQSDGIKQLKKLDLNYHYMSKDMCKQLKTLAINVDVSDAQEEDEDEDWRYPAVTE